MENDPGAARGRVSELCGRDRVGAFAIRGPQPGFIASCPPRDDIHSVGDHENRIEADAELPYQRGAFASLRGLDALHEGPGAGTRDCAERLGHFVAAHSDAVVLDGESARVGVDGEGYA